MVETQKHLFDIEDDVTYLNGAYMSPLLKKVADLGKLQVDVKLKPYQIIGEDFFSNVNNLKTEFARLININDPTRIAIIPSVSYGLANVVNNVSFKGIAKRKTGKEILLAAEQFPSNVYPWMELEKSHNAKVRIIEPPQTLDNRGKQWNE